MKMYNVEFRLGQALVNAENIEAARDYAKQEWGNHNGPYKVTKATKQDEAWVKGMGGMVHDATPNTTE